jgi:hypothetical protein
MLWDDPVLLVGVHDPHEPRMAFIGVRNSWLMRVMNSDLASLASFASRAARFRFSSASRVSASKDRATRC